MEEKLKINQGATYLIALSALRKEMQMFEQLDQFKKIIYVYSEEKVTKKN